MATENEKTTLTSNLAENLEAASRMIELGIEPEPELTDEEKAILYSGGSNITDKKDDGLPF